MMSKLLVFAPSVITSLLSAMFYLLGGAIGIIICVAAAVLAMVMLVAVHRHLLILTRKSPEL